MGIRYAPAILVGRLVRVLARLRKPGGGSAVPGLVVNKIAPQFLSKTLAAMPDGLVIVSGSSGKSTTTKMLVAVLRAHGIEVFTNPSTANISQGLTSSVLEQVTVTGRLPGDVAVLEMDEGHGALIADGLHPRVVVLMNVMVDQIDRFHDSEMVAGMLGKIAKRASDTVVLNADDAYLVELAAALDPGVAVSYFGVSDELLSASPRGLGHTRTAEARMDADSGILISQTAGLDATMLIDGVSQQLKIPARGVHYAVDAAAALASAQVVLGTRWNIEKALTAIGAIPPVFGRGEITVVRGQRVEFVLVQNPASFQLNVDTIEPGTEQIFFAMGSDVRDPSYFWPVDTSRLGRVSMVSGSKAYELALQLAYDGVAVDEVDLDLGSALDRFFELPTPTNGVKTVIFTADSMRRTRAHLGLSTNKESS